MQAKDKIVILRGVVMIIVELFSEENNIKIVAHTRIMFELKIG
jgi:hypothetical protein